MFPSLSVPSKLTEGEGVVGADVFFSLDRDVDQVHFVITVTGR